MDKSTNAARKILLKKIALITVAIILITGVIAGIVTLVEKIKADNKAKELEELSKPGSYVFFQPDYEENIFDDAVYMDKNRFLTYSDGIVKTLISDGDFTPYPPQVEFLDNYFKIIINGDADTYNTLFTEEYYQNNEKRDRFTMQKIYNIEAELLDSYETSITGSKVKYNIYKVSYTILKNNGTFRNDMPEDSYVPQEIELVTADGVTKINSVKTYHAYSE